MFELEEVNYEDTIPFIPPITHGKVIKVYDGDTITIAALLPYENSKLYRFSVRINGIDCPEIWWHLGRQPGTDQSGRRTGGLIPTQRRSGRRGRFRDERCDR